MNRLFAVSLASALLFGCSVSPLGTCTATSNNCVSPATCDLKHDPPICVVPQGACFPGCKTNEQCINTKCVVQAPAVGTVTAPTTWSKRSQTVTVTAVVDGTGGPGVASATLQIAGQPDIAGTTQDSGLIRTYTFSVPGSVQAAGSETPVSFTVIAADTAGHTTPPAAVGSGQLLIDDVGPTVQGVTVNGGVAVQGIKWFKAATTGTIDAQVGIVDAGSGVDPASLTLMMGTTRLDTGTPACAAGASAQALICHFAVPLPRVAAGSQRLLQFAVAGADKAGNAIKTNTAALGIDGKAPSITFTIGGSTSTATTKYPAQNADCGAPLDSTLYCGHDNGHFWRSGDGKYKIIFTVSDSFSAPDNVGSGPDPAGGTCTIAGSTTCAVTYDAASGSFSVPANFATATFASGPEGTGTVTVSVNAKDLVGNTLSAAVSLPIQVTRVKWMRQLPGIVTLTGAPILAAQSQQIIVGGVSSAGDPIGAVKTDGTLSTFKFGSGKFTTVAANMALDTTTSTDATHPTPVLYVNAGTSLYAVNTNDATQYCAAALSSSNMSGSPVIFGGGATADVVVVSGNKIGAFTTSFTSGHTCLPDGSISVTNPPPPTTPPQPKLGPPSANGNTVFFGYDNSSYTVGDLGIKSFHFAPGVFDTPNSVALGKQPSTSTGPAATSPASDLFFGIDFNHKFYDYTLALASSGHSSPLLTASMFWQPTVSGALVFGMTDQLIAYNKADISTVAWTALSGVTEVMPPAIGVGTLYLYEASGNLIHAIDSTTGTTTRSDKWTYGGSGATAPPTTISSLTTETTLGPDGTLYFGDNAGKVYALITDTVPVTTGPGDWPRTGYDNCNSNHANNTGFTCQ